MEPARPDDQFKQCPLKRVAVLLGLFCAPLFKVQCAGACGCTQDDTKGGANSPHLHHHREQQLWGPAAVTAKRKPKADDEKGDGDRHRTSGGCNSQPLTRQTSPTQTNWARGLYTTVTVAPCIAQGTPSVEPDGRTTGPGHVPKTMRSTQRITNQPKRKRKTSDTHA